MYYQVKSHAKKKKKNHLNTAESGIGLAISQQLATMMGDRNIAQSEPGHGACFTPCIKAPVLENSLPAEPTGSLLHF